MMMIPTNEMPTPQQAVLYPEPLGSSASDGPTYDLFSLVLKNSMTPVPDAPDSNEWLSLGKYLHENIHWIHHHGTTFGCCHSLLKWSQECLTYNWLLELHADKRKHLLMLRKQGNQPIVPFFDWCKRGQVNYDPDPEVRRFQELWMATWTTREWLLQHSHTFVADLLADSIHRAFCLATGSLAEVYGIKDWQGKENDQDWYRYADDAIMGLMVHEGELIESKHLLECSASLSEITALLSVPRIGRRLAESRYKDLFDSWYMLPLRAYLGKLGVNGMPELEDLINRYVPSLLVAIDVALNPLLPPFRDVASDRLPDQPFDVLPAGRFATILQFIDELPLLARDEFLDAGKVTAYANDIADNSFSVPWAMMEHAAEPGPGLRNHDFETFNHVSELEQFHYFDFVRWLQCAIWRLRQQYPQWVIGFGYCVGSDAKQRVLMEALLDVGAFRPLIAPAIYSDGKFVYSNRWPEGLGLWVLCATHGMTVFHDLAVRTGKLNTDTYNRYPEDLWREEIRKTRDQLASLFGIDPF